MEVREMPGLRASLFTNRWSSIELTTLDAGLGSYFGTTEGVLVVRAPADSLLGLRSGDVIQRIGGRVPTSPSHALRILRSYEPGDRVELDVMRERRAQRLNAVVPQN
jgi:S1-C subfamily serine protease